MTFLLRSVCLFIMGLTVIGCTGGLSPAPGLESGNSPSTALPSSRTLVIIARGEPPSLAAKSLQPVSNALDRVTPLFNALLDLVDEHGQPHPYLAEALPQLDTPSWVVFADGQMETTYRLRPGLTWHDDTPLTAEDFAFAWRVYSDPRLASAGAVPLNRMLDVLALDRQTIQIRWRQLYPDAAVLDRGFQPLPRHFLEEPFVQLDAAAFARHPFWTQDYLGVGPYRLTRWEPGAYLEASGFEGHALGRPRIDRVRVNIIPDANTVLATLLSGDAHFSLDVAISQQEGSVLEREWAPRGAGSVLFSPTAARVLPIQHRGEIASPPELLDVRVRRALAHAIDKQELNDVLQGGRALITDSVSSPRADYAPRVAAAIAHYPFDLRRTQLLLEEAGLRKSAEHGYSTAEGRPFELDVQHLNGPANEREGALFVAIFKRAGIEARPLLLPVAEAANVQKHAYAPSILPPWPAQGVRAFGTFTSSSIPTAENRWLGANYGGWSNTGFDQHWEAFNLLFDWPLRIQEIVEMERAFSEEVGGIPYYYNVTVNAAVADLSGPTARTGPESGFALAQIYRWQWR